MNAFDIDLENGRSETHNQEEIELPEVPSTALGDLLPGDKGSVISFFTIVFFVVQDFFFPPAFPLEVTNYNPHAGVAYISIKGNNWLC